MTLIQPTLTPPSLRPGDTVALFAPAFQTQPDRLQLAQQRLQQWGLKVIDAVSPLKPEGYFAGSTKAVVNSIHDLFANPEVKALFAIRGGFGCARLLPQLDYALIRANPKQVIGYSDLTALLLAIYHQAGLVTYHGSIGGHELSIFSQNYLYTTLFTKQHICYENPRLEPSSTSIPSHPAPLTLIPGQVRGRLLGGNLAVLASLIGSEFVPPAMAWENSILFLEDVHEDIYRLERMLLQLQLYGLFDYIKGLVFGAFIDCPARVWQSPSLLELLTKIAKTINVPCYANAAIGHHNDNFTLPIGATVLLDANRGHILFEPE